jgi:hypothetical protein
MIDREVIERHGCAKALETLDRIVDEKPEVYHEEAASVLRCLVAIRDHVIERRRQDGPLPDVEELLDRVNAAVSVMTSGSFPVVGINHERLSQARDLMAGLLETAPLTASSDS